MDAITALKSSLRNCVEGIALLAILKGMPIFAAMTMLLQLIGSGLVYYPGGALFLAMALSLYCALITACLGPRFPTLFGKNHEPLFFDTSLSFAEKVQRWRTQPKASLQILSNMVMLSLLGVAVLSV